MTSAPRSLGPHGWQNWRAHEEGADSLGALEFAFYTDAHVIGESVGELGPCQLLNAVPNDLRAGTAEMALVLRTEVHFAPPVREEPPSRTNTASYFGADIDDEFASLASLALGIRCRSGGPIREFRTGQDPRGKPLEVRHRRPSLPPPRYRYPVVPRLGTTVSVADAVGFLGRYPRCSADQAVALVRAARLYQQAVWVTDGDPPLAWLQLVSALEVAAGQWSKDEGTSAKRLRSAMPDLVGLLEQYGGEDLVAEVAPHLADIVKSTNRFLQFALRFLPEPPEPRPPSLAQLDWSQMKRHLGKVYERRSEALHGGIPFPGPMCDPPRAYGDDWAAPAETPLASAAMGDTTWMLKDIPMLLSTFEHIARGALHRWWEQLGADPATSNPPADREQA